MHLFGLDCDHDSYFRLPGKEERDAIGHEPRIEPWWPGSTSLLAALSNSMASSPAADNLTRMHNKLDFFMKVKLQWAGCREIVSLSGQGGAFFLDILFYRTH